MPPKTKLITDSYKKTKNSNNSATKAKTADPKPSTSSVVSAKFEDDMKILKEFDLNWEYGPSMGITRMERWNRADKHGLSPAIEVKQLIESNEQDERYTQCLWNEYKNVI